MSLPLDANVGLQKTVETKLFTKPILGIWFCFLTSLMTLNVDWADSQPDSRSESHESAAPLLSEKPGTALDNRANGIPIFDLRSTASPGKRSGQISLEGLGRCCIHENQTLLPQWRLDLTQCD